MFLLNSRTPLVTEPWYRNYTTTITGTPSTEVTGLFCRIPSVGLLLHTLGFSPRGTCAGSGYGFSESFPILFSRSPGISWILHKEDYFSFAQVLIVMILPWVILLTHREMCQPNPKCQKSDLRCRAYPKNTRILTCFPFPFINLWCRLGPINPWLIVIVKEPLPFRWQWFSHCFDLTTARILIPKLVHIYLRTYFCPTRTPIYHTPFGCP